MGTGPRLAGSTQGGAWEMLHRVTNWGWFPWNVPVNTESPVSQETLGSGQTRTVGHPGSQKPSSVLLCPIRVTLEVSSQPGPVSSSIHRG